jgi:hypothetical protein
MRHRAAVRGEGLSGGSDDQRDAEKGDATISRIGAKLSPRNALRQYIIVYRYIIMYCPFGVGNRWDGFVMPVTST